jgi:hypothetical protein
VCGVADVACAGSANLGMLSELQTAQHPPCSLPTSTYIHHFDCAGLPRNLFLQPNHGHLVSADWQGLWKLDARLEDNLRNMGRLVWYAGVCSNLQSWQKLALIYRSLRLWPGESLYLLLTRGLTFILLVSIWHKAICA